MAEARASAAVGLGNGARASFRARVGGGLPEMGSKQFYVWCLVLAELGLLLWLRQTFRTAQGG